MTDYLLIDSHIHCFKTAEIGRQSMAQLPGTTGNYGTIEEALAAIKKAKLHKAVMVNTIPQAYMYDAAIRSLPPELPTEEGPREEACIRERILERQARLNVWSCQMARENPGLVATIILHPWMDPEAMRQEVMDKVKSQGAKGMKLHPSIGRYYPEDPRMWPAYKAAEELGIPIIFHCGPHPSPESPLVPAEYTRPKHYHSLATRFPQLKIILAHMGIFPSPYWRDLIGPYYEETREVAQHPNIYFDLSASIPWALGGHGLPPEELKRLIQEIGAERVLLGSDWPWLDIGLHIEGLLRLGLSPKENRLIMAENALRLFQLD